MWHYCGSAWAGLCRTEQWSDAMDDFRCPNCGTQEVPTIIVRGSGDASEAREDDVLYRCRVCDEARELASLS